MDADETDSLYAVSTLNPLNQGLKHRTTMAIKVKRSRLNPKSTKPRIET